MNLGDMLTDGDVINEDGLRSALEVQRRTGERLGSTLVRLGLVDEKVLAQMLGEQHEVQGVNPLEVELDYDAVELLDVTQAMRLGSLPLWLEDDVVGVAMADPTDDTVMAELERLTDRSIKAFVAPQMLLYEAIKRAYQGRRGMEPGARSELTRIRSALTTALRDLDALLKG